MSGFEHRLSHHESPERSADEIRAAEELVDRDLMESVIRETLSASQPREPLESGDRKALQAVVERYHKQPLTADPVAKELVRAVLRSAIPAAWVGSAAWDRMTRQIAETFCEDPEMRRRLEDLWSRLCEG